MELFGFDNFIGAQFLSARATNNQIEDPDLAGVLSLKRHVAPLRFLILEAANTKAKHKIAGGLVRIACVVRKGQGPGPRSNTHRS